MKGLVPLAAVCWNLDSDHHERIEISKPNTTQNQSHYLSSLSKMNRRQDPVLTPKRKKTILWICLHTVVHSNNTCTWINSNNACRRENNRLKVTYQEMVTTLHLGLLGAATTKDQATQKDPNVTCLMFCCFLGDWGPCEDSSARSRRPIMYFCALFLSTV